MAKKTREEWLTQLVTALRPMFKKFGKPVPKKVRISCGWPSGGRCNTVGQAWSSTASKDKTFETFISPALSDVPTIAHITVHELVHHAVGNKHGHKKPFADVAKGLGLTGKMTATTATPELAYDLAKITKKLGKYPHAVLNRNTLKKQTTRMLKVTCRDCGCVVRMTKKWLEEADVPTCGCGGEMRRAK